MSSGVKDLPMVLQDLLDTRIPLFKSAPSCLLDAENEVQRIVFFFFLILDYICTQTMFIYLNGYVYLFIWLSVELDIFQEIFCTVSGQGTVPHTSPPRNKTLCVVEEINTQQKIITNAIKKEEMPSVRIELTTSRL